MDQSNSKLKETGKKNIEAILALTPMQQGMLFHYLKNPGSLRYVEQLSLNLTGEIDAAKIGEAWNRVIRINQMLRTVYRWEKIKNPVQMILKKHHLELRYHDFSSRDTREAEELAAQVKAADGDEPFDLHHVAFRVTLCRTAENKALMVISNHHILYDGWSSGILLKEFFVTYNDLLMGRKSIEPQKNKFGSFVKWIIERNLDRKGEQEVFWRDYLTAGTEDVGRREKASGRMKRAIENTAQYRFQLPMELSRRLPSFAKQHKITLSSLLTTAWGLLLQGYNQVEDVIFDTTVSGRSAKIKGVEDIVGMFINTLPLRVRCLPGEKMADLLARQYAESLQREEYENTSLIDINEYVESVRGKNLFDSVVVLENYPLDQQLMQEKGKLTADSYSISGTTHYDLTLIITLFDTIDVDVTFNGDLFDRESIKRLSRYFISVVTELVSGPHRPAGDIEGLPETEREQLQQRLDVLQESIFAAPGVEYVAPRDEVEEKLLEIWSDVLNIEHRYALHASPIGIDHNFFAFGGHSLKATLLLSQIHRVFNVKVPMADLFKSPTIRQIALIIREASEDRYEGIPSAGEKEYYPLSSVQQRMYQLQLLDPGSTAYNVSSVMEVEGDVTAEMIERLNRAFKELIHRHEILRTSFRQVEGEPVQEIHDHAEFELDYIDMSANIESGWSPDQVVKDFVRPFDLSVVPLMRGRMARIAENRHLLMLDMHHTVTDAFSMDIFIKEFTALCRGESLPPLKRQYKDFSQWQYRRLQGGQLKPREDYWVDMFSGEVPVLNLLTDYPRPSVQRFEGERVHFVFDADLTRRIHRLAQTGGTTLFMVLLAAFNVLLYRYTGQEDIVVGTTVAGRSHPDLEGILGLFIETLAIRNAPSGEKSFEVFLQEVRSQTLSAYDNEEYPFRELIKKVGAGSDRSRNPLFDVMLIVQNVDVAELEVEGTTLVPYPYYSEQSKLDLTLEAVEAAGELRFHIEYSTALFKAESIRRMAGHFSRIMEEITADAGVLLSQIDILTPEERRLILEDFKGSRWENGAENYPKDKRMEQLFEQQVSQTPDHIAVVFEDRQLTFRQLDERADIISKLIKEL
jgi:non-ribosomal peptide synthetase component F